MPERSPSPRASIPLHPTARMRELPVGPFLSWLRDEEQKGVSHPREQHKGRTFDYFVVYDFEATCNKSRQLVPQEIIEFSCVVIDGHTLEILPATFQKFVRPTVHPVLDPFCSELTGITQHQVDSGQGLQAVLQCHEQWLRENHILSEEKIFVPVTWTDWDLQVQLEMECGWRHIDKPVYFNQWINLKKVFIHRYKRTMNLRASVEFLKIKWQGRNHCGLDDAQNTARLAVRLIKDGGCFDVTGRFERKRRRQVQDRPQRLQEGKQRKQQASITTWFQSTSKWTSGESNLSSRVDSNEEPRLAGTDSIATSSKGNCLKGNREQKPTIEVSGRTSGDCTQDALTPSSTGRGESALWRDPSLAKCQQVPDQRDQSDHVKCTTSPGQVQGHSRPLERGITGSYGTRPSTLPEKSKQTGVGKTESNTLLCHCRVPAKQRQVKKPGPNLGRLFWSCGKWRITRDGHCNFFVWDQQQQ